MNMWLAVAGVSMALFSGAAVGSPDGDDARAETAVVADTTGKAIFTGKGLCHVCHGANAKGTPLAPDLTDAELLHIDGSVASIVKLVKAGVPAPKKFPAPMPPLGGAQLTDAEVQAVAEYVASLEPGAKAK